ncbi:hypothetical protein Dsin_019612 [Dipteronia sinensis]|uniref:DUF4220 domain-containing protein n=1 Tax=Dipteronia sinensis TaxID=43782 RepID=A0AAE0A7Q8_9ROSI|nr:hypothetical protein Dsin_019612 [Dipteronia sinensis]
MFFSFASSLIFMEIRAFFISSSENPATLWEEWELRMMVLLSLLLQILLIGLGNQRKYIATKWISVLLWLAYLSADSVAINALGILSRSQRNCENKSLDPNYVIMAFWAPFLLLHLGGPDTITAYSLEDNELWSRHLLGLILEAVMAFYVFYRSFKAIALNFVAIPVFIAGLIKYGERNWALRSASSKCLKSSLISRPDPGPNYAKFMEDYSLRDMEGYKLTLNDIPDPETVTLTFASRRNNTIIEDAETLNVSYDFFLTYKRLFADLILSFQDLQKSQSYFKEINWDKAFKVIEIELGFMYDLLFTKVAIVYSIWGGILRFISLSSTVFALMIFIWIIDWHAYSRINVDISLLLLFGAIGLEIYAIVIMLYSDWTMLWLSNNNHHLLANTFYKAISHFKFLIGKKRWSNSIAQYNLVNSCFKDDPAKCSRFLNVSWLYELLEKIKDEPLKDVSDELKLSIFNQILKKSNMAADFRDYKKLCNSRGDWVLKENDCYENKLDWSVEVEFDQSILLWHIATDLCYYSDCKNDQNFVANSEVSKFCEVSRLLSDYMMHILVKLPVMLPDGIGQIRLQDTKAEAKEFIQDRKSRSNEDACLQLLEVVIRIEPSIVKGDRSKSVLFEACKVAQLLQSIEVDKQWDKQRKWEMISHVWVDLMCYAASHCRWNHHAQQLRRGGQLLTHVWLLMAHLGITEQFQISKGHARAKLILG